MFTWQRIVKVKSVYLHVELLIIIFELFILQPFAFLLSLQTYIQNPSEAQRKEHEKFEFELHEVYGVDVLISTGNNQHYPLFIACQEYIYVEQHLIYDTIRGTGVLEYIYVEQYLIYDTIRGTGVHKRYYSRYWSTFTLNNT